MKLTEQELNVLKAVLQDANAADLFSKIEELNNFSIEPVEETFTSYGKKEDWY